MYFELWDLVSRNLLEDFETLTEAVQAAHEWTEANPTVYPEMLALARVDDEHHTTWSARGAEIFALLESQTDDIARRSA